jgi:23S rRNA pseudoU1915 N3-methylase RlmH
MKLFLKFWKTLIAEILDYSKKEENKIEEETVKEAIKILEKAKSDFKRWILLCAEGKLTSEEMGWLIQSDENLAEMVMLRQKGWTKEHLDNFLNEIYRIITCTVDKTLSN